MKRHCASLERENEENQTMTVVNSTQNEDNSFLPRTTVATLDWPNLQLGE